MPRHVLRTLQLSGHVPNHDEYDLPRSHNRVSCHRVHGRHPGVQKDNRGKKASYYTRNENYSG